MLHTQVELTSPAGNKEVWWLPDPDGRVGIHEKIARLVPKPLYVNEKEYWTITQVCVTLPEESIPLDARIARDFCRRAVVTAFMSSAERL